MLTRDERGAEPLMAASEGVNMDWLTRVVRSARSTMDEGIVYPREVEVA